jgi:uncharacterized protein YjbI with pentapeptide repeats
LANWNTLTSEGADFTNLDLSKADISGINFFGANLSGSTFDQTTYQVAGMSGATLANTHWDGAIATDGTAVTVSSLTDLSGATMKNIDMSKWDLSSLTVSQQPMFSVAYMPGASACPAAIPVYWQCRLMRSGGSDYFLVGQYLNFSTTSAAAITVSGTRVLDVDNSAFNSIDVRYASFEAITLSSHTFLNTNFYVTDFTDATFENLVFSDNTNFNYAKFPGTTLRNVRFKNIYGITNGDFTGALLSHVQFDQVVYGLNFTNAVLEDVDFYQLYNGGNFTNAAVDGLRFHGPSFNWMGTPTLTNTRFYGDFYIRTATINKTMTDAVFNGTTISGDHSGTVFANSVLFQKVRFENADLTSASFPAGVDTSGVTYGENVICPNGIVYPNSGHNCP